MLVASGDTGAYSRTDPINFSAEFPGCLPSVTSVGATVLAKDLTETAAVSCSFGWCSGGGLVDPKYFNASHAPWQIPFVQAYLQRKEKKNNILEFCFDAKNRAKFAQRVKLSKVHRRCCLANHFDGRDESRHLLLGLENASCR